MPTHMLVAYLAITLAMALGFFVTDKARRALSPEQKLELMEVFSPLRKYLFIPAIGFIFVAYERPTLSWIVWSFAVCVASFYVLESFAVKHANAAELYRRACSIEAGIVSVGLLAFLAAGLWPFRGA